MSKYLIDTNILIDLLRNKLDVSKFVVSGDLAVSTITLSELFYGAERTYSPQSSYNLIDKLINELNLKILSFDDKSSKLFATLKVKLEKQGQKLEDFDLMIASVAVCEKRILITSNLKHFDRIEELKLWTK